MWVGYLFYPIIGNGNAFYCAHVGRHRRDRTIQPLFPPWHPQAWRLTGRRYSVPQRQRNAHIWGLFSKGTVTTRTILMPVVTGQNSSPELNNRPRALRTYRDTVMVLQRQRLQHDRSWPHDVMLSGVGVRHNRSPNPPWKLREVGTVSAACIATQTLPPCMGQSRGVFPKIAYARNQPVISSAQPVNHNTNTTLSK